MFGGSPAVCKTCLHATVYSVDHVLPRLYSEHNEARWCISSNKVNDNLKSWATVGRDVTEKAQDHRKSTGSKHVHSCFCDLFLLRNRNRQHSWQQTVHMQRICIAVDTASAECLSARCLWMLGPGGELGSQHIQRFLTLKRNPQVEGNVRLWVK